MNLNIKKLTALSGVSLLAFLTTFQPLTNADAALTAPASYDYSYTYSGGTFQTQLGSTPSYTRTADGSYYNYSATFGFGVDSFEVIQTFNRSNSSWTTAPGGRYRPNDTKIGSDSTVGTISNKFYFNFNNQTNKDYRLYFDKSSMANEYISVKLNNIPIYGNFGLIFMGNSELSSLYIPAYSFLEIFRTSTSASAYFDAWYLKDLGLSLSYQEGFDAGYLDGEVDGYASGLGNNPNILLNGFTAMVGILVNFALMIFNLEVFDVSLLSVFGVIAFFVGIIWFLKILRG